MAAIHLLPPTQSVRPALTALRQRARQSPGVPALRLKRHGAWRLLTWSGFERLVDDTARLWRGLGLGRGSRLWVVGDWSEAALASCYAAAALGASVVLGEAAALDADAGPLDAVLADSRADLARVWSLGRGAPAVVVVRQGTPGQDGDGARLHFIDTLLAALPPATGAPAVAATRAAPSDVDTVLAASLASWPALESLLSAWPAQGLLLALPEPMGDPERDRAELAPSALLDTAEGLVALAARVRSRWPAAGSASGRLLAATLQRQATHPLAAWLRGRVRRQLGLGSVRRVLTDRLPGDDTLATLAALGLRPELFSANGARRAAPTLPAANDSGVGDLSAAWQGAAS